MLFKWKFDNFSGRIWRRWNWRTCYNNERSLFFYCVHHLLFRVLEVRFQQERRGNLLRQRWVLEGQMWSSREIWAHVGGRAGSLCDCGKEGYYDERCVSVVHTPTSAYVHQTLFVTNPVAACDKCVPRQNGRSTCCGKGGSWEGKCGRAGDAKFEHTWVEGSKACNTAMPAPQTHNPSALLGKCVIFWIALKSPIIWSATEKRLYIIIVYNTLTIATVYAVGMMPIPSVQLLFLCSVPKVRSKQQRRFYLLRQRWILGRRVRTCRHRPIQTHVGWRPQSLQKTSCRGCRSRNCCGDVECDKKTSPRRFCCHQKFEHCNLDTLYVHDILLIQFNRWFATIT